MLFNRVAIRNFRRLQQPIRIEGLGPGLNVIAGDNEEGKSTVLRALRAALFDRHTLSGNAAAAFQPYGSQVRPEVELEFTLADKHYQLSKGFCQRPSADLIGPDGQHSGPAAEDRLKELLGFEHPDRGPADARHHGTWGMLWIEQGTAFAPLLHNERSKRTLQTTLEAEVGDILGGQQGHAILESVRSAYATFFTKTGRPRGEYSESKKNIETLVAELAEVEAKLQAYESKVDQLQRQREDLRRWDKDQIIDTQTAKLQQAEQAWAALDGLREAVGRAESAQELAASELRGAQARSQQRDSQIQALKRLDEKCAELQRQLEAAQSAAQEQQPQLDQLTTAAQSATAAAAAAQERVNAAEAAQRRQELSRLLAGLRKRLQAAASAAKVGNSAQADAEAIKATPKALETLRLLSQRLFTAQAQLAAGSPEVRFDLQVGVQHHGQPVTPGEPFVVSEETQFSLGELGSITIRPSGKDFAQATQQVQKLRQQLQQQLAQLDAPTLAAAEKALARRQELLQTAATQKELLAAHAPDGVAALEADIARQESELQRLGKTNDSNLNDPQALAEQLQAARAELEAATATAASAATALQDAQEQAAAAKNQLFELRTQLSTQQAEQQRWRELLEDARSRETDDALATALAVADATAKVAATQLQHAKTELTAAEPERLQLELEKARDTLALSKKRYAELQRTTRELQIELQSLGQTGLGERRQELQAELAQAEIHANHLEREAQSLRVLYETLEDCAREAGETFLAPVIERIQPYLRLLMPDAELLLDSDLQLTGIRRNGIDEPFDGLSIGTREQLAVITRLAFADLLHEQGQPVVVIMDDALVYADEARFERMQLILRQAAERYQILILTCRERDYLDLGAPIIRLADCREMAVATA